MNATPKVLHRLLSNLDTTLHSNPRVFLPIYDIAIRRESGGAWYTLRQFFTDCFALWTKRCIPLRKCVNIHTHTHTTAGKRWSHKHRCFKHVHLRQFDTHRFEILTQRCILIRASVHVGVKSISGWEAVEPQTISETSSPIGFKFWHTVAFEYARVFIYGIGCHATGRDAMRRDATGTGWDGTGSHVMGRDGMGRNGMALSHSNAWPGTASNLLNWYGCDHAILQVSAPYSDDKGRK
jgi:hypothetical protein